MERVGVYHKYTTMRDLLLCVWRYVMLWFCFVVNTPLHHHPPTHPIIQTRHL